MEALNPYVIDGKARACLAALYGGTPEENAMRNRIACEARQGLLGEEALAALEQIHARHVPPVRLAAQVAPPAPSPPVATRPPAVVPVRPSAPPIPPAARVQEPDVFSATYAAAIYARRNSDLQRHARGGAAPDAGSDSPPSTNTLDATDIYERRRRDLAVAAGGSRS